MLSPFHRDCSPYFSRISLSIPKNVLSYFDKASFVWSIQKGLTKTDVMAPAIADEHKEFTVDWVLKSSFVFFVNVKIDGVRQSVPDSHWFKAFVKALNSLSPFDGFDCVGY